MGFETRTEQQRKADHDDHCRPYKITNLEFGPYIVGQEEEANGTYHQPAEIAEAVDSAYKYAGNYDDHWLGKQPGRKGIIHLTQQQTATHDQQQDAGQYIAVVFPGCPSLASFYSVHGK